MPTERAGTHSSESGPSPTRPAAIGRPDAKHEREADRVADQVSATHATGGNALGIQRMGNVADERTSVPASVERTLARSGTPLEPALRNDMEQKFGHSFANVRVHADASAAQSARDVSASAYTVGSHIAFGQDRYTPQTGHGRRLIAHELTHVVQGAGAAHHGLLMRQPENKDEEQTKVAVSDPCTDADSQLPSFSAKEEKQRNAILQDMLRGLDANEKKSWCKKIRRALAGFSTRQMQVMKNAGVRFWRSGEFPAPFADKYGPSATKRGEMARYDFPYRIIQGLDTSGPDEVRHELAHAWDHVRSGKVPRLDKLKGKQLDKAMFVSPDFSSEGKEKRVSIDDPAGSGTKKIKLSVQDTFDRFMQRPAQGNWSFANSRTKPEHVTSDIREFYAEGYSVFHGDNEEAQAIMLCDAPELYALLEKEALAEKLKVPDRTKLDALNQASKRKCT